MFALVARTTKIRFNDDDVAVVLFIAPFPNAPSLPSSREEGDHEVMILPVVVVGEGGGQTLSAPPSFNSLPLLSLGSSLLIRIMILS